MVDRVFFGSYGQIKAELKRNETHAHRINGVFATGCHRHRLLYFSIVFEAYSAKTIVQKCYLVSDECRISLYL